MSGNLAFNGCLKSPFKGEAWASRTVLRIFCRFSSIYLATRDLERLTMGSTSYHNLILKGVKILKIFRSMFSTRVFMTLD